MDKIVGLGRGDPSVDGGLLLNDGEEILKLVFRQGMQERLEQYDRFSQARIQIVMAAIEDFPIAIRVHWVTLKNLLGRSLGICRSVPLPAPSVLKFYVEIATAALAAPC